MVNNQPGTYEWGGPVGISGWQKATALLASVVLTLTIAVTPSDGLGADGATAPQPKLFGTKEFRSSKLKKFSKWNGVIARYETELTTQRQKCRVSRVNSCALERWQKFLEDIGTDAPYATGANENLIPGRVLVQDPLQGPAMHFQAPRGLGNIAVTLLEYAQDMFPAHPVGGHRIIGRWWQGPVGFKQRGCDLVRISGFRQKVDSAGLDGHNSRCDIAVAGQHDNPHIRTTAAQC